MCLNNNGDMRRLLGGGLDISYVETLNGKGEGGRAVHSLRTIAIIAVVLGRGVGPVVVHTGHKTSNISLLKCKTQFISFDFRAHQQSGVSPLSESNSARAIW